MREAERSRIGAEADLQAGIGENGLIILWKSSEKPHFVVCRPVGWSFDAT